MARLLNYYIRVMDMERITLTDGAKALLRALGDDASHFGADMLQARESAVLELKRKGLVRCARAEGGVIEAVRLTRYGICYLRDNPSLKNPPDWGRRAAWLSALSLLATIALALVACSALMR